MPKCFHCGELGSDLPTCPTCLNSYCEFHIDPVVHECGLTIESQKFQHEYNVVLHPEIADHNIPGYTVRGSTDGYYAWAPTEVEPQSLKSTSKSGFITQLKDFEGILFLLSLVVLFSLFSLNFWNRQFISLSLLGVIFQYYWTFFTSLFVVTLNTVEGILFFVIDLIFMFMIISRLEKKTSVKLVYSAFGFSGFFSGVMFLLIRSSFSFLIPIDFLDLFFFSVGLGGAGFLGVTTFSVCLDPDLEWNFFPYGIPLKVSGKSMLLIIVALRLVQSFLYGFFSVFGILTSCFELFGILAGFIYFKCWKKYV